MDLRLRLMFMNKLHESVAGTGSICLAAASRVKDSVVNKVARDHGNNQLLIGTPSGIIPVQVKAHPTDSYYPANTLENIDERQDIAKTNRSSPGVVHE